MSQNSSHKLSLWVAFGLSAAALTVSFLNTRGGPVTAAPETLATGESEIEALRNELHGLKSELRARAATAPDSQAGGDRAVHADAARTEPSTELKIKPFEAQPVDRKWAAEAEANVREFFAEQPSIKVQKIECRSQSCRVHYDTTDQMAFRKLMMEGPSDFPVLASFGAQALDANGKPNGYEATFVLRDES